MLGPPAPDFTPVGAGNSQDFFDFLNAFFAGDPAADFNHNGRIDATDLATVKANLGRSLNRTIAAAAAPAPAFSEVPVITAAASLSGSRVWDESTASLLA